MFLGGKNSEIYCDWALMRFKGFLKLIFCNRLEIYLKSDVYCAKLKKVIG